MKKLIYIFILFFAAGVYSNAQMPPANLPDTKLTKEQAALRIEDFQGRVAELETKLKSEKEKVSVARKQLTKVKDRLSKCNDDLKKMLGITDQDIVDFRQQLGVIDGKIRNLKRLSNDKLADAQDQVIALENQLNAMRGKKISLLPEFYNRIIQLAREIKGLHREKRVKMYTVQTWAKERDCLWNISGKADIYADPFLWPKIWQANKGIIRNPDIIHPGQQLEMPRKGPKSSQELKAERKYYRMKKEADAQEVEATAGQ